MRRFRQRALAAIAVAILGILAAAGVVLIEGYVTAPAALRRAARYPLPLKVEDLKPDRQRVLLRVQDPNFYSHPGVDFSASGSGWTTITQGLVKQLYFDHFRPGLLHLGKVRQSLLAIGFNARVPKDEQLRLFLNRVYLGELAGHSVYGFDEASHAYYGKPFADLSREEYVSLVATIVSPATLNPASHRADNLDRVARIERLLKGECTSLGKGDVFYAGCARSTT
jgi:membrane peptidoglycan carboxypeptidase